MRASEVDAEITLIDNTAIIRRKGRADCRARVLGDVREKGLRTIYLDRLVHEPWIEKLGGYSVSGCVSSILTREAGHAD